MLGGWPGKAGRGKKEAKQIKFLHFFALKNQEEWSCIFFIYGPIREIPFCGL
jgi:hypothetical protein